MKGQLLDKIIFVLLLLPLHIFAQPGLLANSDITGLWKGSLYNDTTKKFLPYEIAISSENGKLSGYSYILFDIDGKKELGIKKIKIKIKDDQLTIEDIELISNTYSAPAPKGVRFRGVVNLSVNDTIMQLSGKWNTNRTWQYSPYNGTLQLQRAVDYAPQVLFKKLVELKLDQDLSFVKAGKKTVPVVAIIEKPIGEIKPPVTELSQPEDIARLKKIIAAVLEKKEQMIVKSKAGNNQIKPLDQHVSKSFIDQQKEITIPVPEKIALINNLEIIKNKPPAELFKTTGDKRKTIIALTAKRRETMVAVNIGKKEIEHTVVEVAKKIIPAPAVKKTEPVAIIKEPVKKENKPANEIVKKADPVSTIKEPVKTVSKPATVVIVPTEQKKELPAIVVAPAGPIAAADVFERKMKNERSVFFESDSLVLTLYDNGEVDGDTVSVLMNGQIIFSRQGLTTKANSKTIYIDKGMPDSLSMVMYAENLGSIPPNTGLLIIMDGEKRYEVRFSADLKTNAAILLRRRPKEK
ncbi:MAG: hypothetical protein ABI707_08560 [Ferruginibacter sp.]